MGTGEEAASLINAWAQRGPNRTYFSPMRSQRLSIVEGAGLLRIQIAIRLEQAVEIFDSMTIDGAGRAGVANRGAEQHLYNNRWRMTSQYDFGPYFVKTMLQAAWQAFGILFSMWYTWAFLLFMLALKYGPGIVESRRLSKAGMPEIDRMTGLKFEKYLEIVFVRLGYQVERTVYVGDQGGDLVLTKGGEKILVQAKRHSKAISNKAVQEAAAARPHYKCHRAMVVANQEFTRAAQELAKSNQVELWGRRKLADVVLSPQAPAVPPAPTPIAASRSTTPVPSAHKSAATAPARPTAQRREGAAPTCQRCDKLMVLRDSARGKFWGCSGFPKCRNTLPYVR